MKSQSSKKKIRQDFSKRIQSKILITNNYLNPLMSNISAKIDLMRQTKEQQLVRQYNEKFMTDRKRHKTFYKTLSSSKLSAKDNKPRTPVNIQPKKLNFEADEYREKFYQLNEKYIIQRNKNVEHSEEVLIIKEQIIQFFSKPSLINAEKISKILGKDLLYKNFSKIVEDKERLELLQDIMGEATSLLEVDDYQDLLEAIRNKVGKFKNLDECTFRILELESFNNKLVEQIDEKMKKLKKQFEDMGMRERIKYQQQILILERALEEQKKSTNKQKQLNIQVMKDLQNLHENWWDQKLQLISEKPEVQGIHKIMLALNLKIRDIEVETQENMFRLLKSNEQMVRLQRIMSQLKDDMNKQIEQQELKNEQKSAIIEKLSVVIKDKETQIQRQEKSMIQKNEQHEKMQMKFYDQYNLISCALGLKQTNVSKIMMKLQERNDQIDLLQKENNRLEQLIKQKGRYISQLMVQLEKQNTAANEMKETTKNALFQKDQYKFLLNNLRDQVTEMKKQHNQQKIRIAKEKQQELIRTHKELLESHAALAQQNGQLKRDLSGMRRQGEEGRAEIVFLRKKCDHQEKMINENVATIQQLNYQNQKYKKYLKQIENSFKQMIQIEEASSKKVINLQKKNEEDSSLIKNIQMKNEELEKINNQYIRRHNQLQMELQKCLGNLNTARDQKQKLQNTNVELRLLLLEKQQQLNKGEEQYKNILKDHKIVKSSNEKLLYEVNSITKKLIAYKKQMREDMVKKLKKLAGEMKGLRLKQGLLKQSVRSQMQFSKQFTKIQNELLFKIESKRTEIQQKKREEEDNKRREYQERKNRQKKKEQKNHLGIQCQLNQSQKHNRGVLMNRIKLLSTKIKQITLQKQEISTYVRDFQQSFTSQLFQMIIDAFSGMSNSHDSKRRKKTQKLKQLVQFLRQQFRDFRQQIINSFEVNRMSSWKEQLVQQQLQFMLKRKMSIDQYSAKDEAVLMSSDRSREDKISDYGDVVNLVLSSLLENDTDIPSISFWDQIKINFLNIRRKINRKGMRLDLSAVEFKAQSASSPSSQSFYKQFQFSKRINSEQDQFIERQVKDPIPTRSERGASDIEILRKKNQILQGEVMTLDQQNRVLQERNEQLRDQVQELLRKNVSLQNVTSIKALENSFKKLLDHLFAQNGELFEQTCRILMKLLLFSQNEVKDYEEKFNSRKKKKKNGFLATIFKN